MHLKLLNVKTKVINKGMSDSLKRFTAEYTLYTELNCKCVRKGKSQKRHDTDIKPKTCACNVSVGCTYSDVVFFF